MFFPLCDAERMFPERVHDSRADAEAGWDIKDWDTANNLLSYVDPERRHYAIFTRDDNSYVQCLGRKTALTVEAREYSDSGRFKHWVFGKGDLHGETTTVGGSLGHVTIDASQVLAMRG